MFFDDFMPEENNIPLGENMPGENPQASEQSELTAKIAELEKGIDQFRDQLLRKAAEFENYKRRVENDYSSVVKFSNEDLIIKLLPVLDDFERSMKAQQERVSPGGSNDSSFAKGFELIYNKFKKILETQGVRHFEVIGKPFDPQIHDALMQMPRTDVPPHTVIEEIEKGYMLHDKVIRHARVVVSAEQMLTEGMDGTE